MSVEKQYTGLVLNKGTDRDGAFVTLQIINNYGKHEIGFEVEEKDLDMYHIGQVATITCYFTDAPSPAQGTPEPPDYPTINSHWERLFTAKKVNMNCFKVYFCGAYLNAVSSQERATGLIRQITNAIKKHLRGQYYQGYKAGQEFALAGPQNGQDLAQRIFSAIDAESAAMAKEQPFSTYIPPDEGAVARMLKAIRSALPAPPTGDAPTEKK